MSLAKQSYCYRGAEEWNSFPYNIRKIDTITKFKLEFRKWIKQNAQPF